MSIDIIKGNLNQTAINNMLQMDIKGTIQTATFNSNGDPIKVEHRNSSNVLIREDVLDYSTVNLIIETRTLISTGETLIYKYHTDTSAKEVI